tara:strand:+ start:358 stop:750 length:393 start_codon:yes stop_codon:yes gene_type:complete
MGTVFGGVVMGWMDICAAIAAQRYAGTEAVTASVDDLHFLRPLKVGDTVSLEACVTAVGRTSMEVRVEVNRVPIDRNLPVERTTEAYFTFVAMGPDHRPTKVEPLSRKDKEGATPAEERRARRLERRKKR